MTTQKPDISQQLQLNDQNYTYYSLPEAEKNGLEGISRLPFSLKILLENQLRHFDDKTVTSADLRAFAEWLHNKDLKHEIAYSPARVLMQDFTGVPAVVDLAAMRSAMDNMGGQASQINPLIPVHLVIDHSVQVDHFGNTQAFEENVEIEMKRNLERYEFLRWGQKAFENFHVVPPGTGICHQVNLEHLGQVVWTKQDNDTTIAYPDTLVGTDSHTTMINGLGILGWGVGGIEAEAAILGQPISMLIPEVIGVKLSGQLKPGITATDLVLTITEMLRAEGVVGKFVEYFGQGLKNLSLADRATIANMAPEYGATCGLFPVDQVTLDYLTLTGRDAHTIELVKAYLQAQGMWHDDNTPEAQYTKTLELDLDSIEPCVAGPKRPQDRVRLSKLPEAVDKLIELNGKTAEINESFSNEGKVSMHHGDIVIAAITSCTNTSNPAVLLAAGLVAQKAAAKGLTAKPWVKCSLAPGSKVVTDYLKKTDLLPELEKVGFYLVGYGCTTCIGNSGPLPSVVEETISDYDLVACSVLSGNRNFEGRIHPLVKGNWLASPPLVVAYALAGTTRINLDVDPVGHDQDNNPVYLKDIWPSPDEIQAMMHAIQRDMFTKEYAEVYDGDAQWKNIKIESGDSYQWNADSTYIQHPPFFADMAAQQADEQTDITNASILALLGDSVTTDHISPAGAIKADSPAGKYLQEHHVDPIHFNSYGSRRGNHEVMMRGTFANIRIRNEMVPGIEGGFTKYIPDNQILPIYDAAMRYQQDNTPCVVIAGKEYGTGSSRDWAAKGTRLLGVRAVVAESFERIHRSNLIGMGVLPLRFVDANRKELQLDGTEKITIQNIATLKPNDHITMTITRLDESTQDVELLCRIETDNEMSYFKNGGILQYVLKQLA